MLAPLLRIDSKFEVVDGMSDGTLRSAIMRVRFRIKRFVMQLQKSAVKCGGNDQRLVSRLPCRLGE